MTIPKTMRGVQLTGHGGPEKLVWSDAIPTPRPGPGEALVRVLAAGVNNTDINTRIGWYAKDADSDEGGWAGALPFPLIQGGDLCGEVVALGEGVTHVAPGMRVTCPTNQPEPTADAPTALRVIGSEYDGAFAQYCAVPSRHLYDVTAAPLTDVEVAALPCAHGTAFNLLTRSGVGAGDRVLITGASGGVGLAAVALAKLKGAHVTGMASAAKQDVVREAGADAVLDRGAAPEAGGFTVVIDVVGGGGWGALIEALAPGGRYAVSGAIAGPVVEADLRTIYLGDITIFGCTYQPPEVFAELVALINAGGIRPHVSKTYPLSEIAAAQADFAAKTYPGKLVLIPPTEDDR
jgi:alcohol dehydrogenase